MKTEERDTLREARLRALSGFGLDKPSGDLRSDLFENKKVLIQRGVNLTSVTPEPDMGDGVYQFIASTDGIKRDGNIVMNSGWHFDNFAKNPAFIWCHDYRALPIGQHLKWEVSGTGDESVLRIWSQFCSKELNPFAQRVRKMYDAGFLRAVSIGWAPIKWEWINGDDDSDMGIRFIESDLLEVSAVPVPSDSEAIIEAVHRNIISSDDMERMVEYGALPKVSRGVAYVISNLDVRASDDTVRQGKVAINEDIEGNEMLKDVMNTLTSLGSDVRQMRDDIIAIKARLPDEIEPIATEVESSTETPERAISVNADTTVSDMTVPDDCSDETMTPSVDKDGNQIELACGCVDDQACLRMCSDQIRGAMAHLGGLATRRAVSGRSIEVMEGAACREMVLDLKSKLDGMIPTAEKNDPVVDEAESEFESRLVDIGRELGLIVDEVTVEDILIRARELGVIPHEPIVDSQNDLLGEMLDGLRKV